MKIPSNLQENGRMSYEQIYFSIVKMAEFAGWKVREYSAAKVGVSNLGYCDHPKKTIAILKGSPILQKVLTISHEFFGHAEQWQFLLQNTLKKSFRAPKNKTHRLAGDLVEMIITPKSNGDKSLRNPSKRLLNYSKFFMELRDNTPYSKEMMDVVVYCEVDASIRAKKVLINWFGLTEDEIDLHELNLEIRKDMIDSWKRHYFKGQIPKKK